MVYGKKWIGKGSVAAWEGCQQKDVFEQVQTGAVTVPFSDGCPAFSAHCPLSPTVATRCDMASGHFAALAEAPKAEFSGNRSGQ